MEVKGNYLPNVRAQYEDYPYPPRDPAEERHRILFSVMDALEYANHFGHGGKGDYRQGKYRVLVAGGGTGDSAIFLAEQLRNTSGELVYLDISEASMKVAQERARIRKLTNITWRHGSLLDLSKKEYGLFDYINCSGVLHHLSDPDAGLKALGSVLKPQGLISLMVYGKYGRTGVYQMQELLQRLFGEDTPLEEKLPLTQKILELAPESNLFKMQEQYYIDHKNYGDNGLYDLLLHSQDRAYSVPELYDWIERCGLTNIAIYDPSTAAEYEPATYLRDPALIRKLNTLPLRERQAIGELLSGKIIKHFAYVGHPGTVAASPDDPGMVPFFVRLFYQPEMYHHIYEGIRSARNRVITLTHHKSNAQVKFSVEPHTQLLFKYLDGERSLGDIYDACRNDPEFADNPPPQEELQRDFKKLFRQLHPFGWMILRHRSVPAYPPLQEIIDAQTERNKKEPGETAA